MRSKQDVMIEAYAGFNRRDVDAVLARMAPDVDWPNGMEGGRVAGHEAVRSYWTRQWGMIDPRVEPVTMEEDGSGRMVVTVHQVVRDLSGALLADLLIEHVYTFEDGLIASMEIREIEPA